MRVEPQPYIGCGAELHPKGLKPPHPMKIFLLVTPDLITTATSLPVVLPRPPPHKLFILSWKSTVFIVYRSSGRTKDYLSATVQNCLWAWKIIFYRSGNIIFIRIAILYTNSHTSMKIKIQI